MDDRSIIDGGACDLGLPRWTGGQYQGSHDALLELEGKTEQIEVKLARRYKGGGIGESSIFELGGFLLRRGAESACVHDAASLSYSNSHHNWRDQAVARDGTRKYLLDLTFVTVVDAGTPGWSYSIIAFDGDQKLRGPLPLKLTHGPIYN